MYACPVCDIHVIIFKLNTAGCKAVCVSQETVKVDGGYLLHSIITQIYTKGESSWKSLILILQRRSSIYCR